MNYKPHYALYCAIVVSLGGFVFGFDASVISGVVGFVTTEFNLTPIQSGFVVAAPTLSGLIATPLMGPFADTFGRKKVLIFIAFLYLMSAFASAFATSYLMLVSARGIGGIAFTSLMIAPMYIGEISPAALRGRRVSINQMNIVLGFSAAYFANYFILSMSGWDSAFVTNLGLDTNTWRWMLGLEIIPAAVFFLALFLIPSSPRWLMLKGREPEAREVISSLLPESEVETEITQIKQSSVTQKAPILESLAFIFGPKMRLALIVGLILGVAQQITGINAIFFYAPTIFEQSGIGTNAAFAQAVLVGVINVIFTIMAMALIDKWGRKPLLVLGLSGIAASMILCSYGFSSATYEITPQSIVEIKKVENIEESFDPDSLNALLGTVYQSDVAFKNALQDAIGVEAARDHESSLIKNSVDMNAVIILIGILCFVASFAISLGPVMWVMFAEIFPNKLRGVAISVVGAANSLVSFSIQFWFPWELATFGAAFTFGLFGAFAVFFLMMVLWIVPETKGKSLEELEALFTKE
ncbi:MAG: sugar porter family MFS transporter [Gammaproteobacteria bacterium]|nr:sugar porter family MFS transporter [Gammaproteobacteria bacterium]